MNDDAPASPVNQPELRPSSLSFPVVGIGASAGGISALKRFFSQMPADSGMAFVVVMHLSPKHESTADAVLQRATKMPVHQVHETTAIECNTVYVISPNKHLLMDDGTLRLVELERPPGHHVAIDLFFRALADVHRSKAIALVLSGTGSDGSVGLSRVKEQGGLTLAQTPDDCEYGDMPAHAIAAGLVDFVLPAAELPQKLLDLFATASSIRLPPAEDLDDIPGKRLQADQARQQAEQALRDVLDLLRARTGHDFRHYKRATVLRRLERRMQVNSVTDLGGYLDYLKAHPEETAGLLKDMLIGVTNFFRDRDAFETLERDIIPKLFEGKDADYQVRAWVAACATGEEAYSIAVLLADQASRLESPPSVQVFATDIDEQAIATARSARYPEAIVTDVAPAHLRAYFTREQQRYVVTKQVRSSVLFAMHNLLRDPPFSRLDLICCRNLLIYLDRDVQEQVLQMFHHALRPGGYLFLGNSESAEVASRYFVVVDKKHRIYKSIGNARSARQLALPIAGHIPGSPSLRPSQSDARRGFSFADVHQRAIELYAPPSVVVKTDGAIVHASKRAGDFLRYGAGEPSHSLFTLVLPELRLELRTALFQAAQTGNSIETRRVSIKRDGHDRYVTMTVRPFRDEAAAEDFMLVVFEEVDDTLGSDVVTLGDAEDGTVLARLEDELQRTREHLQNTIEASEASAEEHKASNEELQALNEELRSASEELETSKEELQSINEELTTVNHELKHKVDELSQANDDLQNLISSTDLATIFVDGSLNIKRFTPRAADLFNIIPTDIGRSLLDITHRLDYPDLPEDAQRVFDSLHQVEREVRSLDGSYFIARLLPYRTEQHRIDGAVLTFFDISGRRRAEDELRMGQERLKLAVEGTQDYAIITTDTGGRVTSWNPGAERIFGFTEDEILGEVVDRIFTPDDRERGEPEDERRRAREHGRGEDERWHLRKDGSRFYCSGVMTPLYDDGVLRGYAKIARDLTALKQVEEEREATLKEERKVRVDAESAVALKDEFLAVMSHELKHPLNLINVNADLLTRLPGVRELPPAAKAAETILHAVTTQTRLIDDLLDMSRLHTGKLALTMAEVDLSALVREAVEVVEADSSTSELGFVLRLPQDELRVMADPVRVDQIIWNLLGNAIKFTSGGGSVQVELDRDGTMARLGVTDTGRGIDPELLPRIFDMFGQAGTSVQRNRGGMGIGLALVRQLVERHKGRIEVSSEGVGKGTHVVVWLPLSPALLAEDDAQDEKPSSATSLEGLRVLVVDDAPSTVTSFQMMLELKGATVFPAFGGAEALAIARAEDIDMVLSDIGMPEMDGHELMRELRKLPQYRSTPAIAVSGFGQPQDVRAALDSGFTMHMTKPVEVDNLLQAMLTLRRA